MHINARPSSDGGALRPTDAGALVPPMLRWAPLPTPLGNRAYTVPMQAAMAAFMTCSGPDSVTMYNWNVVLRKLKQHLVDRVGNNAYLDTLRLTSAGEAAARAGDKHGQRRVYTLELACSGASEYGAEQPNCYSACGGVQCCLPGCADAKKRHHKCGARLQLIIRQLGTANILGLLHQQ